ncbi:MAG: acyl-CoA thioesterase [Thermomicrobiales bacterium]
MIPEQEIRTLSRPRRTAKTMKGIDMNDGELVIRVVAMPADTNPSGDVFGGWLLSQMDLAAWVEARQHTPHRLATVAMDNVALHRPVYVGDCLLCYAKVERIGRTSITIQVEAMVERVDGGATEQVTEGRFVLVAIGPDRKPVPIEAEEQTPGQI